MEPQLKTTSAFRNFERSQSQSYELTQLVEIGGVTKMQEYLQFGNLVTQRVAGVDIEEFVGWPQEKKLGLDVSRADLEELLSIQSEVESKVERVQLLLQQTLPGIVLTYLIATFEAYLVDIMRLVFGARPELLDTVIQRRGLQSERKFVDKTIAERVVVLFSSTDLKDIFKDVLQKNLEIDMNLVWNKAGTSYSEIKKAKLIRNLYVHRGGMIDEEFKTKMGQPKLEAGRAYPISFGYLRDLSHKMLFVALGIDLVVVQRYPEVLQDKDRGQVNRVVDADRSQVRPQFGSGRGFMVMAEDFDEPLADFAEYMQ